MLYINIKNKEGFTLAELLVTIAIIGILATVAVVNLNSARDKAKLAAVTAQMNSVIPLIQLCYSFEDEILYDWYFQKNSNNSIPNTKVTLMLKNFKL